MTSAIGFYNYIVFRSDKTTAGFDRTDVYDQAVLIFTFKLI